MWTYEVRSHRLLNAAGQCVSFVGYSGHGAHVNNPESDDLPNLGPLPRGVYHIESPRDTESHGPYVLPLMPDPGNVMYGRDGFLCHGDSIARPGTASLGCIIQPRPIRQLLWTSGDHKLSVVSG